MSEPTQPPPPPPPSDPKSKPWWTDRGKVTGLALGILLAIAITIGATGDGDDSEPAVDDVEAMDEDLDPEEYAAAACAEAEEASDTSAAIASLATAVSASTRLGYDRDQVTDAIDDQCRDDLRDEQPEETADEPDPEPATMDEQAQQIVFRMSIDDDTRAEIIDVLESGRDSETVDRLEYDGDAEAFIVSVTSPWSGEDRQREAAWGIARAMRHFWSDDFWGDIEREPMWNPDLTLTVDAHSYNCPGDVMYDLAQRRLDRAGWEAACQ